MRKLAWFSVGFALATISVLRWNPTLIPWWVLVCFAVVGVVLCMAPPALCKRIGFACLGLSICLCWLQHLEKNQEDWNESHIGDEVTMEATVLDYSQDTDYGSMAEVQWDGCKGYLFLNQHQALEPGDVVAVTCRVTASETYGDLENLWKKALGYDFSASQRGDIFITLAEKTPITAYPTVFAQEIREILPQISNENTRNFLRALLLGEADDLSDLFYNDMCRIGTVHTIAISGMHFTMLMTMLVLIFGRGRRGAVLILAVVWFYVIAVGGKPSVVRAAVMFTFLLMAPIFNRERDVPTSILGALLAILIQNPFAIFSLSLQYSFASVTMICLFASKIFDGIWEHRKIKLLRKKSRLFGGFLRMFGQPLCCTVAVIPATLVLGAYYFEMFSLIAPIANVLIQPVVTVLFCLALPIACLGMAVWPVAVVLMTPLEWLVEYVIVVTDWLASIPFGAIYTNNGYMVIFAVYILFLSIFALISQAKYHRFLPGIYGLGLLLLCCFFSSVEYDRQDFSLTMVDVGQGQCIYMESKGRSVVYDCGGSVDYPGEELFRYLQSIGRTSVDTVVISHYDFDHSGGVAYLLERVEVEQLLLPPLQGDNDMETEILSAARNHGVEVVHVEEDMTWSLGMGTIHVFAPVAWDSENDRSLALWFSMEDYDALMTGDMGITAEKALVYQKSLPDIEVLVAGHHGSSNSTGTGILNTTQPEIILISVGGDNNYGHPNEETLERIANIGAAVYRTDLQGNITIRR